MCKAAGMMGMGGLAILALCIVLEAGSGEQAKAPWKPVLTEPIFRELVEREMKTVQAAIGTTDFEKIKKAKVAALMIAGYTLSVKDGDEAQLKAVRNTALQIAKLLRDPEQADEVKKLAESITSNKVQYSGPDLPLEFKKYVANDLDLMVPYMMKEKGGEGLPEDLQFSPRLKGTQEYVENLLAYMIRRPPTAANLEKGSKELELLALRTAVSAGIIHGYAPRKTATQDPQVWYSTSEAMRDAAISLADAAKRKDGTAIQKSATMLLDSCVACHKMFQ